MIHLRFLGGVVLCLACAGAWATDTIFIDVQDCQIAVADDTPRPDCPTDAACRHAGGSVHWVIRPGMYSFAIEFTGKTPFGSDTSCLDGSQPCSIPGDTEKGSYPYTVDVPECAGMDPRIVIN